MATVLLLHPPLKVQSYPGRPSGLDYLAAALRRAGHRAHVLDLDLTPDDLEPALADLRPDVVGITNVSLQADSANETARSVKALAPGALVVKGGPHETVGWQATLEANPAVDLCVAGEGERALVNVADAVEGRRLAEALLRTPGVASRQGGRPAMPLESVLLDAEDLPVPWRQVHHSRYDFSLFDGRKTAQVMTSRGCRYSCAFCQESWLSKRERPRPIRSVEAELRGLWNDGYRAIYFDDSTFTWDTDRAIEIGRLAGRIGFTWACNTRVDRMSAATAKAFKASGCIYVFCGVESALPGVLRSMRKTSGAERYLAQAKATFAMLADADIDRGAYLVFGGTVAGDGVEQADTLDDAPVSLSFALDDLQPTHLAANLLRLLPGTRFANRTECSCLWPENRSVRAGDYDGAWLHMKGLADRRTWTDASLAVFQAAGSVLPVHVDDGYRRGLLRLVVDAVERSRSNGLDVTTDFEWGQACAVLASGGSDGRRRQEAELG